MKKYLQIILVSILSLTLCSCSSNNRELHEEDIRAICELATYKCYYNNVAELTKKPQNIFQKERTLWLEYEGVATIGVDVSKLSVNIERNKVTITLPPAELFDVSPVIESLNENSYRYSQDGFLIKNKVSAEDQTAAIVQGQSEMEKAVLENSGLFVKAEKRAKDLIEGFIKKMYGEKYKIEWKKALNTEE